LQSLKNKLVFSCCITITEHKIYLRPVHTKNDNCKDSNDNISVHTKDAVVSSDALNIYIFQSMMDYD